MFALASTPYFFMGWGGDCRTEARAHVSQFTSEDLYSRVVELGDEVAAGYFVYSVWGWKVS